jgi:hypothetical protein
MPGAHRVATPWAGGPNAVETQSTYTLDFGLSDSLNREHVAVHAETRAAGYT